MKQMFKLEADVNDFVKAKFAALGLRKRIDYNEESAMSEYMKEALKGAAKTRLKTAFGKPDFHIEKYQIPVVIECKLGNKHHILLSKNEIRMDEKSVQAYAVNGAVYYAKCMLASKKYNEVVAIGVSGDSATDMQISTYYVFSASLTPKQMVNFNRFDFLQSKDSFDAFHKAATVTDQERHKILIETREHILRCAKKLNKLMNNCNISVEQRVVYVSGMLLSMQDVLDGQGRIVDRGMRPEDLQGIQTEQKRDSVVVIKHIEEYLDHRDISTEKRRIMQDSFKMALSLDAARDVLVEPDKTIAKCISGKASVTKQVFTYLYEYVFKAIDLSHGALDIMAEMYSTFLKYALSDGAPLGKVLTPPYITAIMARLLDIDRNSRVMDLATGSAAFLVAAMDLMIRDANKFYGAKTKKASEAIEKIKHQQLLGVEVDAKMYTLAATNMILRGDGSTRISKADTFTTPESLYDEFCADRFLLNPPFSYAEYGMPFFRFGLDHMKKGGRAAVIIQDSAGAGKSAATNKQILARHRMVASIKMPPDLFNPNAIVQTSIYIFEAGTPHNFECDLVKFIDFRTDGYKRTERCIQEVDHPAERYSDLYLIYRLGLQAGVNKDFHGSLWDLKKVYCEDRISDSGADWNFEQHYQYNNERDCSDFFATISSHIAWDIAMKAKQMKPTASLNAIFSACRKKAFPVSKLFDIQRTSGYNKSALKSTGNRDYDYITRTAENRGICGETDFIGKKGLNEAGTYSLGLLQMTFFYRERPWYAGQFVRKVVPRIKLSYRAALFFESILQGLSPCLLAGLVRSVDSTFLNAKIVLPVDASDNIDFAWIDKFMAKCEKDASRLILKSCFVPA